YTYIFEYSFHSDYLINSISKCLRKLFPSICQSSFTSNSNQYSTCVGRSWLLNKTDLRGSIFGILLAKSLYTAVPTTGISGPLLTLFLNKLSPSSNIQCPTKLAILG